MVYKKLQILVSAFIVVTGLRADLSVSYQSFQPDDVVIDAGKFKMTAKQLEKYGIEPVKVTVTNYGMCEELFVPDRPCVSADEVYKHLKYSLPVTGAKWLSVCFVVVSCIFPLGICMYDSNLFEQIDQFLDNPTMPHIEMWKNVCRNHPPVLAWVSFLGGSTVTMLTASLFSANGLNKDLYDFCEHNLTSNDMVMLPGTTGTKLMFIAKEQGKK